MNYIKQKILLPLILFLVGINQLYWSLAPHISTYNNESLHTSLNMMLQATTTIGPDIVMIILGLLTTGFACRSTIIKAWLNTLILGCITCLILMFGTHYVTPAAVYDACFPILRNSYPLITGTIIGLLISKIVDQLPNIWQQRCTYLIVILITIPLFSTPNMFGWVDHGMSLFYALLFILGRNGFEFLASKSGRRNWLLLGIASYILNCFLQFIMPSFSINGSTISRFANSANILSVITAFTIVLVIRKWLVMSPWLLLSFLVLIENSAVSDWLSGIVNDEIDHSSFKTGVIAAIAVIVVIFIAWGWVKSSRLPFITRYLMRINHFTQQSFPNQLVFLKSKFSSAILWQLLASYLLAFVSILLMSDSWRIKPNAALNYNVFAYLLGQRQLLIILNALFIFATMKLIQAITRRYWVSLSLTLLINIVLIIANREKIAARAEPVLPADLIMLKVGKQLFGMISLQVWLISLAVFIIIVVGTVWLERRHPVMTHWSWRRTTLYCLLLPLMLVSSLLWNQPKTPLNNFLNSIGDTPMFYNQLSGARINGPIVQYLNNVDITVMAKPAGYSAATMKKIVNRYQAEAQEINRHRHNRLSDQTIIFNLSESFANPNRVPGVKLKNNPIPFITKMTKQNTGGIMVSSGYGGGTANMEYMTLTGYSLCNFSPTLPTPYTQLVPTLQKNPSIVDEFKHSVAIHPYIGVFYSRTTVYKKFGFDRFMYLGSKYPIKHQYKIDRSPYLSDKTAYANALDQIDNNQRGQFVNLVTMQNHFPYDQHFYNNDPRYAATTVSDGTNIDSVNDFATGIHHTDSYLQTFIKQIDRINKPITIVFYGDHLPGIYGNDMSKDGLKLHETDYFIYSNKYARTHGARNFSANTHFVSPNDFIAMVAKQTNSKVNWYQALLTTVYEKLPALTINTNESTTNSYNTSSELINQKGKVVKESHLSRKQKQILHDYRLLQYDVTAGKHYTNRYFK